LKIADTAHKEGPSALAEAAELEMRNVSKRYPGQRQPAINDLSLTVPAGEVCVLVGPSGSGKTTAMRLINRMISTSGGDILLGGRSVLEREPRELRREIGYVIQQIGLFPHQTVGENIATVPRLLGWDKPRTAKRVSELLELIGLDPEEMRDRYPAQLSGGQRQRVGVARALAADPPLMLMDEPFGAIDPINRAHLQDEFLRLQAQVRKTIVFVTHDIDEAIKMGDRIAILREGGVLAQYDTPEEILAHPADDFVAQFVGADRALKRLGLATLADIELVQPNGLRPNGDSVSLKTSVRDALSLLLSNGGRPLTVLDGEGDGQVAPDDVSGPQGDGGPQRDGDPQGDGDARDARPAGRVVGLLTLETVSGLLDERDTR
jgi:osmoprotectant transport system ATP-binding protein